MTETDAGDEAMVEPAPDQGPPVAARRQRKPARKQVSLWRELPVLLIVAVGLAFLIKSVLVQAFFIPSGSMENTLDINDRVLVNKLVYDFRDPHRGEIVVFNGKNSGFANIHEQSPASGNFLVSGLRHVQSFIGLGGNPNESDFIKRVVAVGGDTVSCPAERADPDACSGIVVNGHPVVETAYLLENMGTYTAPDQAVFAAKTVPRGQLFVMGDHRDDSSDSRYNGTIPVSSVIGRAFVTVWPPSRVGGLGVPAAWHQDLSAAARTLQVGAAPAIAALAVLPVGLRRRRRARADRT